MAEKEIDNKPTRLETNVAQQVVKQLAEAQGNKRNSKEKKFMKIKLSKNQLLKNYVYLLLLKTNGYAITKKVQVKEGAIYIPENKTWHMAKGMHIWHTKGKVPFMILPEWSVEPIYRDLLSKESIEKGISTEGQRFTMKKAEEHAAGIKPAKGGGWSPLVVGIIIVGILVAYGISVLAGKPLF